MNKRVEKLVAHFTHTIEGMEARKSDRDNELVILDESMFPGHDLSIKLHNIKDIYVIKIIRIPLGEKRPPE